MPPAPVPVPPLVICPASPTVGAAEERLATYRSPRSQFKLYTPRTHAEQLSITGANLGDAFQASEAIAEAIVQLSARAQRQRSAYVATALENADANAANACPICLERLCEPMTCANKHRFCSACLRSYRRSWPNSPRVLCPLCRVAMPEVLELSLNACDPPPLSPAQ